MNIFKALANLKLRLDRWACEHNYQPERFQSLTPGTDECCTKCGHQRTVYDKRYS